MEVLTYLSYLDFTMFSNMCSVIVFLKIFMTGIVYKTADLLACITFPYVQKTSRAGFKWLLLLFSRLERLKSELRKIFCGRETAVAVMLDSMLKRYAEPHSKASGFPPAD